MDKTLRKHALDLFAKQMQELLPTFVPFKGKSKYFFGSEKVWEDVSSVPNANLYIVFTPEFKGRNQFTIEVGWSKLRRFPQVSRRPSLAFEPDFQGCYERPEATTRLPYLAGGDEWIDVNSDNLEAAILGQLNNLIDYGLPFLRGVAKLA